MEKNAARSASTRSEDTQRINNAVCCGNRCLQTDADITHLCLQTTRTHTHTHPSSQTTTHAIVFHSFNSVDSNYKAITLYFLLLFLSSPLLIENFVYMVSLSLCIPVFLSSQAVDSRDSVAMALYSQCFSWIIMRINQKIKGKDNFKSIGILDIFGFENFEVRV